MMMPWNHADSMPLSSCTAPLGAWVCLNHWTALRASREHQCLHRNSDTETPRRIITNYKREYTFVRRIWRRFFSARPNQLANIHRTHKPRVKLRPANETTQHKSATSFKTRRLAVWCPYACLLPTAPNCCSSRPGFFTNTSSTTSSSSSKTSSSNCRRIEAAPEGLQAIPSPPHPTTET